jgi:hypothetical protein
LARLPFAEAAEFDPRKLTDYCLDPDHPRGRDKARLFRAALDLGRADAIWLRQQILAGVLHANAIEDASDQFGARYRVDVAIRRQDRHAVVRTVWIVPQGGINPRFVTCWVL